MGLDIDNFGQTLCYEVTAAPDSIGADLARLRAFDQEAEAKQRSWVNWLILWCVLAFLSFPAIAILVGIPLFGFFVWKAYKAHGEWKRYKRLNLEDRRYQLVGRLLPLLEVDLLPGSALHVKLDLRPRDEPDKHTHDSKLGIWQVKHYLDPWLELRARLADGTQLKLLMTDKHQARVKHYRSQSGKSKTKRKNKTASQLLLQLKPKPKRYGDLAALSPGAGGAVQLPEGVELKGVDCASGVLSLKSARKDEWQAADGERWVSLGLLSAYQVLNLARRIHRSSA